MKFTRPSRKFMIMWAILMLGICLSNVHRAHAIPITGYGNGGIIVSNCGWTDARASRQAINLGYGFAAVGGALWFVPGFAIGGLIIGGISGAMDIAMTMSGC